MVSLLFKWKHFFKKILRGKQNDLDPSPKSDLFLDQIITIQLVQFKG